jgi:hypothetical protein
MLLGMIYKLGLVIFWAPFWMLGALDIVWDFNFKMAYGGDDPAQCEVFWCGYVLAMIFMTELTLVHFVFETIIHYILTFRVKAKYGFNKATFGSFITQRLVMTLFDTARFFGYSLLIMSLFSLGERPSMNGYLFYGILTLMTTIVVVFDIFIFSKLHYMRGNMAPLEDGELKEEISRF